MKKPKIKKIIFILVLLIMIISINQTEVKAWSQIISDGQDFISTGESSGQGHVDQAKMQNLSGYLYNILLGAGVIVAVVVATVLGIQFMIGGAEGQAKVKEMLVPYIVGCIIVFGGFGLWKIAVTIGSSMDKGAGGSTSNWVQDNTNNIGGSTANLVQK
ncbi:MAG: hypothetical protein HFJ50_09455 [Clostridia bacterium]|jgi:hypothetical protein|nr:hypothetical protein [Clostridia bacterium]